MKGWTPDGREITLLPWQAEAVRSIISLSDSGAGRIWIQRGRMNGWGIVRATTARLIGEQEPGEQLHAATLTRSLTALGDSTSASVPSSLVHAPAGTSCSVPGSGSGLVSHSLSPD